MSALPLAGLPSHGLLSSQDSVRVLWADSQDITYVHVSDPSSSASVIRPEAYADLILRFHKKQVAKMGKGRSALIELAASGGVE